MHEIWSKGHKRNKQPPDYLNDLNAMHEAEKVLTSPQWDKYTVALLFATEHRMFCAATAAQRAEAFLKTLNLWTD